MKKKYKRALAAALAAVMIWNTCDWHPQVLAGSSVQYIEEVKELSDEILHQEVPYGTKYKDLELPDKLKVRVLAEEASDKEDGAEDKDGAEKIATPSDLQSGDGEVETEKKSQTLSSSETDGIVRKASPSEADGTEKSEIGGVDDTEQKASPSDAEGTKTDKNWKEVKVRWVLDETFSEKDTYDGETPGIYVFDAELRSSRYELDTGFLPSIEVMVLPEEKGPAIIGFSELDETVAVQKLPLGAKESDIILPDTLEVELEEADETLAEDSQNVHLVEAVNKGTEKDTEAETAVWQISGITWKLNEEQSDLPEFHGGISEKDYFEEFDENGEPVETSTKTWAGYAEANQEYNGRVYVYTPILPEDLGKFEVADTADLPEIDVMVGDAGVALLADGPYDLNENYLVIDGNNVKEYPFSQLRKKVGMVPQQAVLFKGTIRDNMKWGKEDASEEEIQRALSIAQASGFVKSKPEGLNTMVSQGGANLSGGQRQRLTIARALVGDPEILIMDDSASALDFATDAALRHAIHEQTKGMTVFIVSQRATSIKQADKILVLDDGELAGVGTHKELMESCEVYREICLSQLSEQEVNR